MCSEWVHWVCAVCVLADFRRAEGRAQLTLHTNIFLYFVCFVATCGGFEAATTAGGLAEVATAGGRLVLTATAGGRLLLPTTGGRLFALLLV